jgi:hypothetical protein
MIGLGILFLSTAASATLPEKPLHSVSEENVLRAHCTRSLPFTENEMMRWLDSQSTARTNAKIHGIELVDESPYLIQLLDTLLTQEKWSSAPQKAYSSSCKDVYCAAAEIFGSKTGIQLLYMLGRFGFNGSHLRIKNADAWTGEELDNVLLALSDLPKQLTPASPITYNHQLAHYKRSESGTPEKGQPIANAMIFLFDHWNEQSEANQRYTLFHEFGHVVGDDLKLSDSKSWFHAAGWKETNMEWQLPHPEETISQYAEANPYEDFAESFAAYRYNPETLKALNPGVYRYFKDKVFHRIEYTNDRNCEIAN